MVFLAMEAGAAAWMAPVWAMLEQSVRIFLSSAAHDHLARQKIAVPNSVIVTDDQFLSEMFESLPSVVISSATGSPFEVASVVRGRAGGSATLQVVDTWGPYRPRFMGGSWPDKIAVIDPVSRMEAIGDGIPPALIVEVGQPAWESAPELPSAPRQTVMFVSQPISKWYGKSLGFDEHTVWAALVDATKENPNLIQRLIYVMHPSETEMPEIVDAEVQRVGALALREAGTVVSMFSSLMTDAFLGGRCVISMQPGGLKGDLCALSRYGYIPLVSDSHHIAEAIQQPPQSASKLQKALAGSSQRAVSLITHLLECSPVRVL